MATTIAFICILVMILSIPLILLKPQLVFYIFLFFKIFENIFGGYIAAANNLGFPRTWLPGDTLWFTTLIAAFFVQYEKRFDTDTVGKCLSIIFFISIFSLIQGTIMFFESALTYSRVIHFVAAIIFGLRYFTNYRRTNALFKFLIFSIIVMFVLQVLIRFGLFTPPISEQIKTTSLSGERGTYALVPLLYIALIAIAIGRLVTKSGSRTISFIAILASISGVLLSETRSTYGAVGVLFLSSMIFIRGRIKTLVLFGLMTIMAVYIANQIGFEFLARFEQDSSPVATAISAFKGTTWRAKEYGILANVYKETPGFILTGRGVGALHQSTGRGLKYGGQIGYYHSEYLGWLDRCGLIGLFALISLMVTATWRSFILTKNEIPQIRCYAITTFLLFISLMAEGLFHPIFSNSRAASILICFAVIIANWQYIYYDFYEWQDASSTYEPQENVPHQLDVDFA